MSITDRYQRYYTYLEPVVADPLVRGYFSLVASLFLIAFFLIFALSPTINTILSLRKKIAEQQTTIAALDAKISALVTAHQNYLSAQPYLPSLLAALPDSPMPQTATTTLTNVASGSAVILGTAQFKDINLSAAQYEKAASPTVGFTFSVSGTMVNVRQFVTALEGSRRYIRVNTLSIAIKDNLNVTVDGRAQAYYYAKQK
ncbi:MAG: hypothetical protein M1484_04995 [Patescibacteria group bacterium]|nr:hypothetical protein [Patescibacteria group bacterium]